MDMPSESAEKPRDEFDSFLAHAVEEETALAQAEHIRRSIMTKAYEKLPDYLLFPLTGPTEEIAQSHFDMEAVAYRITNQERMREAYAPYTEDKETLEDLIDEFALSVAKRKMTFEAFVLREVAIIMGAYELGASTDEPSAAADMDHAKQLLIATLIARGDITPGDSWFAFLNDFIPAKRFEVPSAEADEYLLQATKNMERDVQMAEEANHVFNELRELLGPFFSEEDDMIEQRPSAIAHSLMIIATEPDIPERLSKFDEAARQLSIQPDLLKKLLAVLDKMPPIQISKD